VPLHYPRVGGLRDDDWARLARRMGEVAEAPLLLAYGPAHAAPMPTAAQQIEAGRDLAARHDLKVLLVDGLPAAVTADELFELKALAVTQASAWSRSSLKGPTVIGRTSNAQRACPRTSWSASTATTTWPWGRRVHVRGKLTCSSYGTGAAPSAPSRSPSRALRPLRRHGLCQRCDVSLALRRTCGWLLVSGCTCGKTSS